MPVPTPYSASQLTFPSSVAASVSPGDLFQFSVTDHATLARVVSLSADGKTVYLDRTFGYWTAGNTITVLKGVQAAVELLPLTAGEPLYEKQWLNAYFFFRNTTIDSFDVSFSTEKQAVPIEQSVDGATQGEWLYDETLGFGLSAWGSPALNVVRKAPLNQPAARAAELTIRIACGDALAHWELSALRVPYDPSTMRAVR